MEGVPEMSAPDTREIVPLVYVSDITASRTFYGKGLGFDAADTWEPEGRLNWCRMQRGDASIMLQQDGDEDPPADQRGKGVAFFFICRDAGAVYDEITARGIEASPPEVAFYAMKQTFITDPDGYKLCFESPAPEGGSAG